MTASSGASDGQPAGVDREARPARRRRLGAGVRALSVNPLFLLFGPTFQREMRVAGRKRSTYAFRSAFTLTMLGLAALMYLGAREDVGRQSSVRALQSLQMVAPMVAFVVLLFQFVALVLLAPSLTGGLINDEKRNRTLPALLTTTLPSAEIVLGKLMSRVVMLVILLALTAPILLAVRVFGGVGAMSVIAALLVTLSTAVFAASAALLASVWTRKSSTASNTGLGLVFVVNMIPVAIAFWPVGGPPGRPNLSSDLWSFCSPLVLMQVIQEMVSPGAASPGGPVAQDRWIINSASSLGLAAVCVVGTIAGFRRAQRTETAVSVDTDDDDDATTDETSAAPAEATGEPEGSLPAEATGREAEGDSAPGGAGSAAKHRRARRRRRSRNRTVGDRPVLWRELRQRTFRSWARLVFALGMTGGLAILLYLNTNLHRPDSYWMIALIGVFGIIVQMATATTSNIPSEQEARTWGTLLTTPLSGREILLSKYLGVLRQAWYVPAGIVLHLGLVGSLGFKMVAPIAVAHLLLICLGVTGLLAGTGLLLGLVLKRGAIASTVNLLGAAVLWLGVPLVAELVMALMPTADPTWVQTGVVLTNPLGLTGLAIEGGIQSGLRPHDIAWSRLSYDMPWREVGPIGFTMLVGGMSLLGVAFGLLAALWGGRIARRVSAAGI